MHKLIVSLTIAVIVLLLSSCFSIGGSRVDMLNSFDDDERADARLEQILEAIKNKDQDAITAMFSEEALTEAGNLDEGMKYLFTLFPNGVDSWDQIGGRVSESNDHGKKTKSSSYRYSISVAEDQYWFSILEYVKDADHPEKIGLFSISVVNKNDKEPEEWTPGIYLPEDSQSNEQPTVDSTGIYMPEE